VSDAASLEYNGPSFRQALDEVRDAHTLGCVTRDGVQR
jgi:hypothetical protein